MTAEQLLAFAAESARYGAKPTEFWTFDAKADASPLIGEYRPGDFCEVNIGADHYLESDLYTRRITQLDGDHEGQWVTVTTGEVFAEVG